MATRITNQATLTYQYAGTTGQAASNIATALLQEALSVAKTTLDAGYRRNGELTYNTHRHQLRRKRPYKRCA